MRKIVRVFAPGKLMMMGEHAVVYGYRCISLAVDKGVTVEASEIQEEDEIVSDVADHRFISAAKEEFFKHVDKKFNISLSIRSDISGYGLGSSSAVTVAVVTALMILYQIPFSKKRIFNWSYAAVRKIHDTSSGYDVATATYGGVILFDGKTKKVKKLKVEDIPFLVGFSLVKADTPALIAKVAKMREEEPGKIDTIFCQMNELVQQGVKALLGKNWKLLGSLFDMNQTLLLSLGVSTPFLDTMIHSARENGACGAKLSGAGGGDCIIILYQEDDKEKIKDAFQKLGVTILPLKISGKGVRQL